MSTPELSIVVVVFNMGREAHRTLYSLSPGYQVDVDADRYEVIVMDNGSDVPLGEEAVKRYGEGFRYEYIAEALESPASAMNRGASLAAGKWLGLMIDGARLVTPEVISSAIFLLEHLDGSLVETMGFHLGPDIQVRSAQEGYDSDVEDTLLASIEWPVDGYQLFEIASLAGACRGGWLAPIAESNCMFMSAEDFERHGGYDERFDEPGGGFVNLDFYRRVALDSSLKRIRLLGEANFHQFHGGAATGLDPRTLAVQVCRWRRQYAQIVGTEHRTPDGLPFLHGRVGSHSGSADKRRQMRMESLRTKLFGAARGLP